MESSSHSEGQPPLALRALGLAFGWASYFLAVRTILYLIGFLANRVVGTTIDGEGGGSSWLDAAWDLGLLAAFALPHSLLARGPAKRLVLGRLPAWAERAVYGLIASLSLIFVMWQWRPLPAPVWEFAPGSVSEAVAWGLFLIGWVLSFVASWTLGHLQLFGLAPAVAWARGRPLPEPTLVTRGLYARLRNPMYLGFLLGVWATPRMTAGHLLFAVAMTAYVLVGVRFEERSLAARFGPAYQDYCLRVPRWGVGRRATVC
ncbi:MAG TPA: isoprenylcysteine carboxylmethyltransferase family protein [Thermoanaerobaculia bacterium]|nr:isoprenylcysteine carboxylmethyltransferase family protein [Thermoanaerobaculia bacterium]